MQSFPLHITPGASVSIQITGDLFSYESGTSAGNTTIIAKPEIGNEIQLKPGQLYRLKRGETAGRWFVTAKDGVSDIVGNIIIGEGEFFDANTLNKVTIDGSFVNSVTVNNSTAQRVPVTLDTTQALNTTVAPMAYTNAFNTTASCVGATPIQIVSAAANVNGIVINQVEMGGQCAFGTHISVVAKATAPTAYGDGELLATHTVQDGTTAQSTPSTEFYRAPNLKVAAGKALYFNSDVGDPNVRKSILYTIL